MVKLGMTPSEFWAMTLPETVAMLNMHASANKGGKPKLSDDWVQEELAWLRGEDAAGN